MQASRAASHYCPESRTVSEFSPLSKVKHTVNGSSGVEYLGPIRTFAKCPTARVWHEAVTVS